MGKSSVFWLKGYKKAMHLQPAVQEAATICPRPLQVHLWPFDLESGVRVSHAWRTWATSVPILVFLGLSVLDLGPVYATDRRQTA